jgi:hypothetical protein
MNPDINNSNIVLLHKIASLEAELTAAHQEIDQLKRAINNVEYHRLLLELNDNTNPVYLQRKSVAWKECVSLAAFVPEIDEQT